MQYFYKGTDSHFGQFLRIAALSSYSLQILAQNTTAPLMLSAVCLLFNDTMDQQSWMEMPTNGQSLLWHMSIHQNYNLPPSCPNDAFMSFCTSNEDEHLTNIYFSKLRSQRHLFWQLTPIPSTATDITSPVGHNSMCYTRRRNSSQRKGAPISCCCVQYRV